jgi:hypothetical protein
MVEMQRTWAACVNEDQVVFDDEAKKQLKAIFDDSKTQWLSKLDGTSWNKAAATVNKAASDASRISQLDAECSSGSDAACVALSKEDEAKRRWLAKLDVPSWKRAAEVTTQVSDATAATAALDAQCLAGNDAACDALSAEEAAKKAWLAKLEASKWRPAAHVVKQVILDAAPMDALDAQCSEGDDKACDMLTREEEAKQRWLAKIGEPKTYRRKKSATPSATSYAPAPPTSQIPSTSQEEGNGEAAKKRWLEKLQASKWKKTASVVKEAADHASYVHKLDKECSSGVEEACDTLSSEEDAKKRWLSKLDAKSWRRTQRVVKKVSDASENIAKLEEDCNSGVDTACESISAEEEAKKKWLAKLEAARWGRGGQAKEVVSDAAQMATLDEQCESGHQVSCDLLEQEEEAKKRWLSKMEARRGKSGSAQSKRYASARPKQSSAKYAPAPSRVHAPAPATPYDAAEAARQKYRAKTGKPKYR